MIERSDLTNEELRGYAEHQHWPMREMARELLHHRAAKEASAGQVRAAVREAVYGELMAIAKRQMVQSISIHLDSFQRITSAIADRVSAQLGPVAPSLDDRAALRDAFHCLTHHCNRFDEHHARARVVVNRLAGRDSDG